jgi:hypothetical protein
LRSLSIDDGALDATVHVWDEQAGRGGGDIVTCLRCGALASPELRDRVSAALRGAGTASTKDADLAYWAGLFDGEGCVLIARGRNPGRKVVQHWLTVSVSNTDLDVLRELGERFGGSIATDRTRKPHWHTCYHWHTSGRIAAAFLSAILPFARVKRAQIELALAFQSSLDGRARTAEVQAERDAVYYQLRAMKRA